jgi:hypothetical protein
MKNIISILLLVLTLINDAQGQTYDDKLYLHNGSVLTGKLIHYNPADTIIFALSESEIIRFPAKIVKKVTMAKISLHQEEVFRFKSPTWYIRSQVSLLHSKFNKGLSLSLSGGYQFNHWLAVGIGAGIDNYYTTKGQNIYPVFGEIRASLFKKNKTPYFAVRTGYGFVKADAGEGQSFARGSLMFNPVFGYRLGGGRPNFDIFAGARFQSARYTIHDAWSITDRDIDFRRYDIGFGMVF